MELILVRHATTQGNLEKRFVGRLDIPLCPQGEALAQESAAYMPEVEHLYVSPMLRCRQTADYLWRDVEKTTVDDLRETDFGPFEGKNHEELKDDPWYQRWLKGELSAGEPAEECAHRGVRALEQVLADAREHGYEKVGIVTHGGLMMGMLTLCGEPKRERYYDWYPMNCGGYRAEVTESPLTLRILDTVGRKEA
ncbi:MAG: histidine phosphatase family protein [Clostridia bacterium]|nr:histidine phosphatase family protein [Clostridia bacterium]